MTRAWHTVYVFVFLHSATFFTQKWLQASRVPKIRKKIEQHPSEIISPKQIESVHCFVKHLILNTMTQAVMSCFVYSKHFLSVYNITICAISHTVSLYQMQLHFKMYFLSNNHVFISVLSISFSM